MLAFRFRHSGGRLVQEQHARPAGERDGDLEETLHAVWKIRRALVEHVGETEPLRQFDDLVDDRALAAGNPPPIPPASNSLRDRETDGLQGSHCGKQLIDLEGPGQPSPDAPLWPKERDI